MPASRTLKQNKPKQVFVMSRAKPFRQLSWWTLPAIIVLSALSGCGESEPERTVIRPVRATKVADVGGLQRRGFPGRAQATQTVDLAFRVNGPLITFPVNVGDEVTEGDVVARIDPRDFEVNLRNVRSQLAESKARLDRTEKSLRRQLSILQEDPGATSDAAVDRAREQRDRAAANVDSLTASVRSANDQLDDSNLGAPFDGVVVATFVENFENVRANQPIVRILDQSHVEMVVNVPENLITLVPLVQSVTMQFDAFPGREFKGTVKEIGTEASQTTRTFPVTLIMEQPEDALVLPGMAGGARVDEMNESEQRARKGLGVPISAVFTPDAETRSHIWVVKPTEGDLGVLERRPVVTGDLTRLGVFITEGLSAGEMVVTAGVHSVQEGQTVRILKENGI
jgi:RND family efflux transporter MFP subunit